MTQFRLPSMPDDASGGGLCDEWLSVQGGRMPVSLRAVELGDIQMTTRGERIGSA